MRERIPCVVPFCRRTMNADGHSTEHICGKHWRHADRDLRRRYNKLKRWAEPLLEMAPDKHSPAARAEIIATVDELYEMWGRLKCQAIEGAMGIG